MPEKIRPACCELYALSTPAVLVEIGFQQPSYDPAFAAALLAFAFAWPVALAFDFELPELLEPLPELLDPLPELLEPLPELLEPLAFAAALLALAFACPLALAVELEFPLPDAAVANPP